MKVLLIGNYINNRQLSMQRFAEMMRQGLTDAGHEVRLVRPPVLLGHLWPGETGLGKWIGYIDRFLLYAPLLRRQLRWADVVHICDQANAVYIPHLRGKRHVLTCHDMLAIRTALGEISESPVRWTGRIYQRWILRNLRRAQTVACVSRQTCEEVRRLADLSDDRLAIVPNALNYPYRPMGRDQALVRITKLGIGPETPFFLHVGGNDWYKNRPGVLRIFSSLAERAQYRGWRLVMAGKPWSSTMRSLAQHLGLSRQVHELVEVSNEDLRALYSLAKALLFPSLQEGFGWPIVEAQACGCPVIVTNRAPMTEVSGGAAIFIDPAKPESAASQIESSWDRCDELVRAGLTNAGRYDIKTMIDGYLAAYTARPLEASAVEERVRSCAV